ncbi:MAG: hypothetical protein ING29_07625 [Azospirillum sp.]|nr:hypothetical protein [Azospirillum sp.]
MKLYAIAPDGTPVFVHDYAGEALGEDYALADVVENFALGRFEGDVLVLTRKELRDMKNFADAYSFDHAEGFIEMCLEMSRVAATLPGDMVRFVSEFG